MATQATAAVWEAEELAECLRCGYPTTVAPVARGVVVAGGILCDDCRFHLIHIGEWGDFLARLTRPADAGDDDPDGGPAAPAAAAPVDLAVSAARSARPFTHLSELSDAERAEYEAWAAEVEASAPPPEPCIACNRPASPYQDTDAGPLCWKCWPTGPRPDRAALAALWVDTLTELKAAYAALGRIDALLERIRQGASTGRM
jgi:hypothetical protein